MERHFPKEKNILDRKVMETTDCNRVQHDTSWRKKGTSVSEAIHQMRAYSRHYSKCQWDSNSRLQPIHQLNRQGPGEDNDLWTDCVDGVQMTNVHMTIRSKSRSILRMLESATLRVR